MLNEIVVGKKLNAVLLVRVEASGVTKNGSFYARGTVTDKTAMINFICFDDETAKKICANDNKPMQLAGLIQSDSYSGGRQLKVERAEEINIMTDISHLPTDDRAVEIGKLVTSFEQLCTTVTRPGFDNLLIWLKTTDYFNAPASVNHHGAYEGGLLEHSLSTYTNLKKLSQISWTEGYYHKPRIDMEVLWEFGNGIIVISGCMNGLISKAIERDELEKAKDLVKAFKQRFGEDFYIEVQSHNPKEL